MRGLAGIIREIAMFKAGDKVRYVRGGQLDPEQHDYSHQFKDRTQVFTVEESDRDGWLEIKEQSNWYSQKHFIPADAVIHTETQEEYDYLMKELEEIGYKRGNGLKPTDADWWGRYKKETCIWIDCEITYSSGSFARGEGRKIILFKEIYGDVVKKTESDSVFTVYGFPVYLNPGQIISLSDELPTKKKTIMQKLTNTLKRVLNKDMQAQYKACFRNGDLELTQKGANALLEILAVKHEKELADAAREVIEEAEE